MAFRQQEQPRRRRIDNDSEGDAEASTSFPEQCGKLKVGSHIVISGRPCKIIEVNTSKKGKHGSCKARIVGKDIFTNKKMDVISGTQDNVYCPVITRKEYQLLELFPEGGVTLSCSKGENGPEVTRADLRLPEDDEKITERCQLLFSQGKGVTVSVIQCMGQERITSIKERH